MRRAKAETRTLAGITVRELIDATPWPVAIVGSDRVIQAMNLAGCANLGVTPEQIAGQRIGVRMAPSEWAKYEAHLDRWFEGTLYPIRFRWPRGEGATDFLLAPSFLNGHPALLFSFLPAAVIEALPLRPADAAQSVGDLLGRLGPASEAATSARAGDAELLRLTPRQWEIARRIAEGDRVTLLAEDLGISTNTVRNHLKEIFRKLNVASQAQLVRRVKRRTL
jgi:DNA-binding CsgD family transcriptional regulator